MAFCGAPVSPQHVPAIVKELVRLATKAKNEATRVAADKKGRCSREHQPDTKHTAQPSLVFWWRRSRALRRLIAPFLCVLVALGLERWRVRELFLLDIHRELNGTIRVMRDFQFIHLQGNVLLTDTEETTNADDEPLNGFTVFAEDEVVNASNLGFVRRGYGLADQVLVSENCIRILPKDLSGDRCLWWRGLLRTRWTLTRRGLRHALC